MSTSQPPTVDPAAREMIAAVREFVNLISSNALRLRMQRSEAEKGVYALAVLEDLMGRDLQPLVVSHDALAAALNAASSETPPILSLTTKEPA